MYLKNISFFGALTLASFSSYATNGMELSGYGPVSAGMGGTSQAFDIGLSALLNNPATINLNDNYLASYEIGGGNLGPSINVKYKPFNINDDSKGVGYVIPSAGYSFKRKDINYSFGLMGQGGMGTEFGKANITGGNPNLFSGGLSMNGAQTPLSGEDNRSELSIGRLMFGANKKISDRLVVGGTVDYVWSTLDIRMDMSGQQFGTLIGKGNVSGGLLQDLQGLIASNVIQDVNWARFDFSDNSSFYGATSGKGLSGKIGFAYFVDNKTTIGGSYTPKTNLSDLTGKASLKMSVKSSADLDGDGNVGGAEILPVTGTISVKDFQWPSIFSIGVSHIINNKWRVAADYKRINWASTMKSFNMDFVADNSPKNGAFANKNLEVKLDQNWSSQNIFMIGANYKFNRALHFNMGFNISSNPVPSKDINPLFPATTEKHYTVGYTYDWDDGSRFGLSVVASPKVTVKGDGDLNNGLSIEHQQFNYQLSYSKHW